MNKEIDAFVKTNEKLIICGQHDQKTIDQMNEVAKSAEHAVLCGDGHFGYVMSIGGVAAYRNKVSPTGAGYDIACGNCAVKTNLNGLSSIGEFGSPKRNLMAKSIYASLEFGIGKKNNSNDAPIADNIFIDPRWESIPASARDDLKEKARRQLGTIGSSNHYLDVFEDENGSIWVGVHCGSRGLGHTIASGFMALSQNAQWGARVPEVECLLGLDTPLGDAYWNAMCLAGDYAYAGREWVVRHVVAALGGQVEELVHNHHNFCWKETHFGEDFIVVRKGSTPAFPGQMSFIGGSMGDNAVIACGCDTILNKNLLCSTVHGAGRVMSRTQAAGKKDWKTGKRKTEGVISQQMMFDWLMQKQVTLVGGGLDEAPQAYRRLTEVLKAQGDSISVVHTLKPHIVCMAGEKDFDPYAESTTPP